MEKKQLNKKEGGKVITTSKASPPLHELLTQYTAMYYDTPRTEEKAILAHRIKELKLRIEKEAQDDLAD